jgi:hypothetical protein
VYIGSEYADVCNVVYSFLELDRPTVISIRRGLKETELFLLIVITYRCDINHWFPKCSLQIPLDLQPVPRESIETFL